MPILRRGVSIIRLVLKDWTRRSIAIVNYWTLREPNIWRETERLRQGPSTVIGQSEGLSVSGEAYVSGHLRVTF